MGAAFGCGQCLPCRMRKRREWTHRIVLEAAAHSENSFVTLTYANENLRLNAAGLAQLWPRDLQLWLKRLRISYGVRLRFFGVGEYSESWRPHYHVMLFGFKGCVRGDSRWGPQPCKCASCSLVRKTWPLGLVHQGCVERTSAQYIAGYAVKRMTNKDDPRLGGRSPEFARMSLQGGVGSSAVSSIAESIKRFRLDFGGDAPAALFHGRKLLPLGRYLVRALRRELGLNEKGPVRWQEEDWLQPMRELASKLSDPALFPPGTFSEEILRRLLAADGEETEKVMAARRKIYERGKK